LSRAPSSCSLTERTSSALAARHSHSPAPRAPSRIGKRRSRAALLLWVVRRPEREVVAEELHDERRVLVALLVERVELGDGFVERLLGECARLRRFVLDLVEEDGIVEGEAEAEGVGRRKVPGALGGCPVGLLGIYRVFLFNRLFGELGEVAIVVRLLLILSVQLLILSVQE